MIIMRFANNWMNDMMYNRRGGNYSIGDRNFSGYFPFMLCGMLVFIALVILVVYLLVRNRRSHKEEPRMRESQAMGILRMRFANSEISEDEFNRKRELLEGKGIEK